MGVMAESESVVEFASLPIPVSILDDASYKQKDALVPALVHPLVRQCSYLGLDSPNRYLSVHLRHHGWISGPPADRP